MKLLLLVLAVCVTYCHANGGRGLSLRRGVGDIGRRDVGLVGADRRVRRDFALFGARSQVKALHDIPPGPAVCSDGRRVYRRDILACIADMIDTNHDGIITR